MAKGKKKHLKASDVPAAVSVLGLTLPIRLVKSLRQEGEALDAAYNHTNNTIELCTGVQPDQIVSTLFHEMIHAAFDRSGQKVYLDTIPNLEEALVLVMETAFAHAIDLSKLIVKGDVNEKGKDHDSIDSGISRGSSDGAVSS